MSGAVLPRRRAFWRGGLLVALAGAAALVVPTSFGAAAGPPLPPGTHDGVTPHVYPGGGIGSFGDAALRGRVDSIGTTNSPLVGMAASPTAGGYWLVGADGGIYALGTAHFHGSLGGGPLNGPIVGMAPTPDGKGYWLVALDGGVFTYGDAHFYGSLGGHPPAAPIVGMAAMSSGKGYWLAGATGTVYPFGHARAYGDDAGFASGAPVSGIAATADGAGYWLVNGAGAVLAYGDARYEGGVNGQGIPDGIVSIAVTPNGRGYWLLGWGGVVYPFGNAHFYGDAAGFPSTAPTTAILPTADGGGYWILEPDGIATSFSNPPAVGTYPGAAATVAAAESQVDFDPDGGGFCNPYGPCEEWCALFASWALQQGGVPIPSYAFTGDIWYWNAGYGRDIPPTAHPAPGDAILYGTGPSSTSTSVHTGIVAQVWPDGAIITIEGDAGPSVSGHLAVVMNGPFLPGDSSWVNGFPIYGFAQP